MCVRMKCGRFPKALGLGTAAVMLLGWTALVQPAKAAAAAAAKTAFSPEAVDKAIKKGVEYLLKAQGADGSWPAYEKYLVGPTAIATYALLESDQVRVSDAKIKIALDWLARRQAPIRLLASIRSGMAANEGTFSPYCHKTYEIGLRANAFLAAVKRSGGSQSPYKHFLNNDVTMLWMSTADGSYNYDCFANGKSSGDNSNSQYGLLGVWAGAQIDLDVPRDYWYKVLTHWLGCQASDGGWGYNNNREVSATMTTAGLASLFVCYDNFLADGFIRCDQGPKVQAVLRPLNNGLGWLDKNFGGIAQAAGKWGYYLLYGVERVGLASGYKYFGKTDWYKVCAEGLLGSQNKDDGSWQGGADPVVDTSYALLFLVRGRHSILFNKLEYDGDWNDRPRDLAQLTRWIGKEFEGITVNWQIVNLQVPPEDWLDAPILYISGSTEPKFTDEQIAAVRRYVNMGGTILSCTECDGKGFHDGIRAVYAKMFPKYKLELVPQDHRLFSMNFKLDSRIGTLQGLAMIHNGVRPLVIHSDRDLARSWQLMLDNSDKPSFQGPANFALYLTDGGVVEKSLAARGATVWPDKPTFKPANQVRVARLTYNTTGGTEGNCDPEPLAWERFSRLMGQKHETQIEVSELMPISKLAESGADVAVLCGTDRIAVNDQEMKVLQAFVAGGGLLYLEAVGGAGPNRSAAAFAESAEALASQIAAGLDSSAATSKRPRRLSGDSPMFARKDLAIDKVRYRKFSYSRMIDPREQGPMLRGILNNKNMPVILLSNEDITGGLVGYACFEVHGYRPESAFEMMRNIVLTEAHAPVAGQWPASQPATQPASQPASGPAKTN